MSLKLYRLLLKLYPAGFRERYGVPLEQSFRDEYDEAPNAAARAKLWVRTLGDLAVSVPAQFAREFRQDARHALRQWRHRPLPVLLATAALAIGIGANVGVFSVVNALLLRSLPFEHADRLAKLHLHFPVGFDATSPQFHQWRAASAYAEDAIRYCRSEVNLGGDGPAVRVKLTETTWNFFDMLGRRPMVGRGFDKGEDEPGKNAVAVISFALWQQAFGGDPGAIGKTISLNGTPLTVIGVAQPGFDFPQRTLVWTPTTFEFSRIPKSGVAFLEFVARTKAQLSRDQAVQAFEAEALPAAKERMLQDPDARPRLMPLRDELAGPVKKVSLVLLAGVALILLIACANVANLLLARTVERSQELAIRSALGASRGRLSQQLLTESLLLAGIATGAGMAVAYWTASLVAAVEPQATTAQAYKLLDAPVLAFALGLALLTGVLFGVVPALHASRVQQSSPFVRNASTGPHRNRIRSLLVAAQVALTVVLLCGAAVLGRTFLKLLNTDMGYRTANVVSMSVSLAGTRHAEKPLGAVYVSDALDRIRRVPGVASASGAEFLPLVSTSFMGGQFSIGGHEERTMAILVPVLPEFFSTMSGNVLYGRDLQESDLNSADEVAVVSDDFARKFGDPRDAVGQMLTSGREKPRLIVGVVRALHFSGPRDSGGGQVFVPSKSPLYVTFVARTQGNAKESLAAIRDALYSLDTKVPVFNVKTMDERLAEAMVRPRFYTTAVVSLGGLALLLAVLGVYGVVAYTVSQQTREFGIRLALGTTAPKLRGRLVAGALATILAGAVPGVAMAFGAGRFLNSLLPEAKPLDPLTCAAVVLLLAAVAAASVWAATRRIARLELAETLRAY